MVIAKDGKRKRKILPRAPPPQPVPSTEASSPELPKRTKVQAQRKFAQGQSALQCGLIVSGSSASTSSMSLAVQTAIQQQQLSNGGVIGASSSSTAAPVADSTPKELIPNHRPDANDFLTFLCYRGTKALPPHLDYLNQTKKQLENPPLNSESTRLIQLPHKASTSKTSPVRQANSPQKAIEKDDKNNKTTEISPKVIASPTKSTDEPKKFIPFAVRKHSDTVLPELSKRQKLVNEAIKKQTDNMPIKKRRGRQSKPEDESTNGDTADSESKILDEVAQPVKMSPVAKKKRAQATQANKQPETAKATPPPPAKSVKENKLNNSVEKPKPQPKKTTRQSAPANESIDTSSEMESKTDARVTRRNAANYLEEDDESIEDLPAVAVSKKKLLAKSTKDASKKLPEIVPKKTVADKKPMPTKEGKVEADFSSDDDRPLIAVAKSKASSKSHEPQKSELEKPPSASKQTGRKKKPPEKEKPPEKSEKAESVASSNGSSTFKNKSKESKKLKHSKGKDKTSAPSVKTKKNESESDEVATTSKKISNNSASKTQRNAPNNSVADLSQTDQSENETRRPMRKTKEAATIYMELIGQKLNLGASDDDNDSMDSLELPNVRKTEQMENEMKNEMKKAANKGGSTKKLPGDNKKKKVAPKRGRPKKDDVTSDQQENANSERVDSDIVETSGGEEASDGRRSPKQSGSKKRGRKSRTQTKNKELKAKEEKASDKGESKSESDHPKRVRKTKLPPKESVNKSFSDSDDEPLAVIFNKQMQAGSSSGKSMQRRGARSIDSTDGLQQRSTALDDSCFLKPDAVSDDRPGAASLLPSKEESQKIFGIASVTLAQSSGPNDTKCTLGKCGSVHKTSLGPVVPTEAYLGENLSVKDRRKAKVNMTHEQIQKWLTECPYPPDPVYDDIGEFDMTVSPKPICYLTGHETQIGGSPNSSSGLSKHMRAKHASGSSSSPATVSSARGPSLKAKPVVALKKRKFKYNFKDDDEDEYDEDDFNDEEDNFDYEDEDDEDYNEPKNARKAQLKIPVPVKEIRDEPNGIGKLNLKPIESLLQRTAVTSPEVKPLVRTSPIQPAPPPPNDKKSIFNQRRTPVYRQEPVTPVKPEKEMVVKPSNTFKAFSPENEPSVYSFDKEQDDVVAPTPFRRQSIRRESIHSRKDDDSKERTPMKASTSAAAAAEEALRSIPLTFESPQSKQQIVNTIASANGPIELRSPSAEATNDDSDSGVGHTFYIPLQTTGLPGSALSSLVTAQGSGIKSEQSIHGVAVKLSTEGPEGPNQRVIMHAKLVTKAQMTNANATVTSGTSLPAGIQDVNELVKNVIINMGGTTKSVPVGTVQPRFKSSDSQTSKSVAIDPPQSSCSSTSHNKTPAGKNKANKSDGLPPLSPSNNTAFPHRGDPSQMVDAPTFAPSEKDFADPIEFIERIAPIAARFGLCRIIPPASFKPECRISDDMRFSIYNQYVHKMLHRWGPSAKEFCAIKKYLATQSISLVQPPWIGGMEIDLPRLYHTVQELGGLKDVIEKKKWARVAEEMCIPKSAQDRVTKLDDIYCKYLLPYDTLSTTERQKLFDEVEADWAKREAKARRNADRRVSIDNISNESEDDEDESSDASDDGGSVLECMVKGRSMALNAFYRIARNTMALWFKNTQEATPAEIEAEFWRHVAVRDSHVCTHTASIDSAGWGYGFPNAKTKNSPCARHPWNLKVMTNNHGSVLRSLGPVTGVTVPTLHVGMLFSACCWYRDPHGLPWIEYLHTGANKIWYSVPDEQSGNFRTALTSLVPTHCQNKTIWLPSDTAMVPPHMLTDRGVSLCRTEQQPGQFVVVFPRAYTSSVCTGYAVSESVYFATNSWLSTAQDDFKDVHDSCEPAMFSLEQLLFSIAQDQRSNLETLGQILPMIEKVYEREISEMKLLNDAGVVVQEKMQTKPRKSQPEEEKECEVCRANLYISLVQTEDKNLYCLQHALKYIQKKRIESKQCKISYMYSTLDIKIMLHKIRERLNGVAKKKPKKRAY